MRHSHRLQYHVTSLYYAPSNWYNLRAQQSTFAASCFSAKLPLPYCQRNSQKLKARAARVCSSDYWLYLLWNEDKSPTWRLLMSLWRLIKQQCWAALLSSIAEQHYWACIAELLMPLWASLFNYNQNTKSFSEMATKIIDWYVFSQIWIETIFNMTEQWTCCSFICNQQRMNLLQY